MDLSENNTFKTILKDEFDLEYTDELEHYYVKDYNDAEYSSTIYSYIKNCFLCSEIEEILTELNDESHIHSWGKSWNEDEEHVYKFVDWICKLLICNEKFVETNESNTNYGGINMKLRIKQTDELSIDEFKENPKAYESVKIILNKEAVNQWAKDYGSVNFDYHFSDSYYYLTFSESVVLEFLNKALITDSTSIPYVLIDKVVGTYYLKCDE